MRDASSAAPTLAVLLGALLGCDSTGPGAAGSLTGSFGTPIQDRAGYFALNLEQHGSRVSGRAWSTFSPTLLGGATVSGSFEPPTVSLVIHPRLGLSDWTFEGTLVGDTLKGSFGLAGSFEEVVELPRVDTIPLGEYSMSVSGAVRDSAIGSAWFTYAGGSYLLQQRFDIFSLSGSAMQVFWRRRDLPPRGTYQLSSTLGPAPTAQFSFREPGGQDVPYTLQNGSITIALSTRYALAGSYSFTATSAAGAVVNVKGKFSSGCWSTSC